MSPADSPVQTPALPPEEAVRAEMYGLLAHVFAAGPGAALLDTIAASPAELGAPGEALGDAWRVLKLAAGAAEAGALEIEHAELFVGTGRARVSIYASHYLSDTWKEHTLVGLRNELQGLGLARQPGVTQPEDHLAALLDVMRHLSRRGAALDIQRHFFERYLGPWIERFASEVARADGATFYRAAAKMLVAFCDMERQAFNLVE